VFIGSDTKFDAIEDVLFPMFEDRGDVFWLFHNNETETRWTHERPCRSIFLIVASPSAVNARSNEYVSDTAELPEVSL